MTEINPGRLLPSGIYGETQRKEFIGSTRRMKAKGKQTGRAASFRVELRQGAATALPHHPSVNMSAMVYSVRPSDKTLCPHNSQLLVHLTPELGSLTAKPQHS
jgi:hypothetical protein